MIFWIENCSVWDLKWNHHQVNILTIFPIPFGIIEWKNVLNAPHTWNDQFIVQTHFCTDPLTSQKSFFNFIASPGFVYVFSISTLCFSLTILIFKSSATPIRYFYLKATIKVSHIKWPHQMHWNMLGAFCFCHTILLCSEACSSGRGFNLFSLTKLHHTHCLTSPKSSISFVNLTRN